MKKIMLIVLLIISATLYSQKYNTVVDISLSQKTVGLDIGAINLKTNLYTKIDFGFHYKDIEPSYLNLNLGYVFDNNIYATSIIGLYAPYDVSQPIDFNVGGEVGYIIKSKDYNEKIVKGYSLSTFFTNNMVGLKFGIVLDSKTAK